MMSLLVLASLALAPARSPLPQVYKLPSALDGAVVEKGIPIGYQHARLLNPEPQKVPDQLSPELRFLFDLIRKDADAASAWSKRRLLILEEFRGGEEILKVVDAARIRDALSGCKSEPWTDYLGKSEPPLSHDYVLVAFPCPDAGGERSVFFALTYWRNKLSKVTMSDHLVDVVVRREDQKPVPPSAE